MADDISVTPGAGKTIAADEVSSVLHQRIKRSVGADGSATDFLDKSSRSDTYTAAASGTTVDVSAQGMSKFGLQVTQTGTVTSWTVVLEGSLDNTTFTALLTHTKAAQGSGAVIWLGANAAPCLYFRSRCSEITLGGGTNAIAVIVGLP